MVKSPLWETTPGALNALINSGKFVYSTLITITFNSSDEYVPHQITFPKGSVDTQPIEASWAPDSSRLVYASLSEGIKAVDPDGGNNVVLASRTDYADDVIAGPTISPDGTQIAFVRYAANAQLWVMNADGSSPAMVYEDTLHNGIVTPNWGSNGKIVFRSAGAFWTINPDGTGVAALFTPPTLGFNPKYSPDATRLLWWGRAGIGLSALWVANADGSSPKQLITFLTDGWVETASWSSDGKKIIFSANAQSSNIISGSGVWMMNADGTSPHKIVTAVAKYGPYEAYDRDGFAPKYATISPNFRWISYFLSPQQDQGLAGIWIFKVPTPLSLRENMPIANNVSTQAEPVNSIYLTDADTNITLYTGSPEWDSRSVLIDQANSQIKAHWKRGLDVDQSIIVFNPRVKDLLTGEAFPDKIGSIPWVEAARQGVFNGVDIQIDRAYFEEWPPPLPRTITPVGVLTIFAGSAVEVDATDTTVVITLNDYRELLTTMIPPDVYSGQCNLTLFSPGCKLIAANFKDTGTLVGGSTRTTLLTSAVTALGSGTFAQGKIRMTTGLNKGFVRTISVWDAGTPNRFGLLNPFPFAVTIGDGFEIYPGCNKTEPTCELFGNKDNFGGYITIPTATSAI